MTEDGLWAETTGEPEERVKEKPGTHQAGEGPELSFEAGVENLERVVKALEQREVPLETALALFKEGVGLVRHCSRLLDQAEQEMRILVEEDGKLQIKTVNFPSEG
ncbi:exodeoxyribonuclease VII [Acididesulfobacillus acetoxydans]|uniref:Exodeoxyribonuclease 7 small subunit n=1 Tax=Acididesulfobacillus acetoxydans TaxID=1561005 RepID=A0A8S0XYB1_9FIRM|nr:exodeoxyribonuclease VII small subunit [Acididesulfobacillus acetoxydans]CAA7602117.1 exodeoxyribonuclease VII [Acididesulfobacillus acetoxydans]CEJ08040.1 Exonuclease VII small subunit [Acididesulfobacillus acetoxydans]